MALSKRGRPRLRHFLYLMTMCMVMTNPEVRTLHHYNVEGKKLKKMKSIIKPVDPHQLMHSQDEKKRGVSGDDTQKGSDPFR
jgi:hypothetical protein